MNQRVILITGTSSGLGKALSESLSDQYIIYGTCRDTAKIDPPSKENYRILPLHMSDTTTIDKVVDTIMEQEGRIDILVNNAGQGITGPFEEVLQEDVEGIFRTNYFGPVYLIQKVLPLMRKRQRGLVINITSVAAYMGLPFRSFYSASKAALDISTESARMELNGTGVEIVNVAPGEVNTPIASRRFNTDLQKDSFYEKKYQFSIEKMDADVSKGADPRDIAKQIIAIIEKPSKKKPRYIVGGFLEKIAVVLKKILPASIFESIMKLFYKI